MHRQNLKRSCLTPFAAAAIGLLSSATMAAAAAAAGVAPEVPPEQNYGAVSYRTGGVGMDEAQAMREISPHYPLTLTFAERAADGRSMFTAGVDVQIVDASGAVRFDAVAEGPMMLVDLPSGEYTVKADLNGDDKATEVSLRSGEPSKLVFVWPAQDAAG
jgi:hypothetical protein